MRKYKPSDINVLIACEESQAECVEFLKLGFNCYSCDLQSARYYPDRHFKGDVRPLLHPPFTAVTESGVPVTISHWHLIIAHPPCTYLTKCGSPLMIVNGKLSEWRWCKMWDARYFFFEYLCSDANYVAVENPIPMKRAQLPKPDCAINPSDYGVKYTKKTLYWLRNLPPLIPTIFYPSPKSFVRASRGKYRSRTFPQVARAIAEQWGHYILDELNNK